MSETVAEARHEPDTRLGHVAVVHVTVVEQIVGFDVERIGVGLPRQTGINDGVGVVVLYLSAGVSIGAHAVLETVFGIERQLVGDG